MMKSEVFIVGLALICFTAGCQSGDQTQAVESPQVATQQIQEKGIPTLLPEEAKTVEVEQVSQGDEPMLEIESSAFKQGEVIPAKFTCDAEDISPDLSWSGAPDRTVSFALIMDDPDAPVGTWDHWLLYNIPAEVTEIAPGIAPEVEFPDGSRHGKNSWGRIDYGGPCPPSGTHRYYFRLFALDTLLDLEPGATKTELQEAMTGRILAEAELMGTYSR